MIARIPLALLLALYCTACPKAGPIVKVRVHGLEAGVLQKVAVAPFYPVPGLMARPDPKVESGALVADQIAGFVAEALAARGIDVVTPSDLVLAFEGTGLVIPRQDPGSVARVANSQLGATSVILGKVNRYRERSGEALGSLQPASVHFELTLYKAPGGEPLWNAHFDQTQQSITANVMMARKYPGGGTRWLSAAELSRWGAQNAIEALPAGLR